MENKIDAKEQTDIKNLQNNDENQDSSDDAKWNDFKKKTILRLDRRKHSKKENIRLAISVATIIFIIGLFLPLIGANIKLSMLNTSNENFTRETVIFEPKEDITKVAASDFIFHKPLRNYELFGKRVGEMHILGLNIYDVVTSPMPNYDGIKKADGFIKNGLIPFINSKEFKGFCKNNLGDFGKKVVEVSAVVSDVAKSVSGGLDTVANVLDKVKDVSDTVREDIKSVENTLSTIETTGGIFFIIVLIIMLITIFWKRPTYVFSIILSVFSVIFIAIGIAVLIINGQIYDALNGSLNESYNAIVYMINRIIPGLADAIINLTGADKIALVIKASLYCGVGWWFTTIGLVATTLLSFVQTKIRKTEMMPKSLPEATEAEPAE